MSILKESTQDESLNEALEQIEEVRRVIRVSSRGEKTRRIKCRAGFRREGDRCVPMTGSEKQSKRLSIRRAVRTKNANPSGKRRAARKQLKAMRKRKAYGL